MKNIRDLFTLEEKFVAWMLLAMLPRGLLQFFCFKWSWGSTIFDMYYLFVLHFSLLFSIEFLCKKIFKTEIADTQNYYLSPAKYWFFIFPMVPIITLITSSSYRINISAFQYIPTFMVERNFLPSGMIFVIPILLFFLTRQVMNHTNLGLVKSFIIVAAANTISYIVYYQWLLQLFYKSRVYFSSNTAMSLYSLFGIAMLMIIQINLIQRKFISKGWLKVGWFMGYMYAFILLTQIAKYFLPEPIF